jgi:hypothetical protein
MAPGIVPGGCDTWEHVFEFEQTTVRKGSAASTQEVVPLAVELRRRSNT